MRYFDRRSGFTSDSLPVDAKEIIQATAHNSRVFDDDGLGDRENYTVGSIKYEQEDRDRPKFRELDSFSEGLQTEAAKKILDLFGYGRSVSKFQLESWETILRYRDAVTSSGGSGDRAAVVTAPTGFGKTAAFMGPALLNSADQGGSRSIIIYPSRALLKDQLRRVLRAAHRIKSEEELEWADKISVGVWMGDQPYKKEDVTDEDENHSFVNTDANPPKLEVVSHWDSEQSTFYAESRSLPRDNPGYRIAEDDTDAIHSDVKFTDQELVLHRKGIRDSDGPFADKPDILLTTLESLETIAMKPHYDLVMDAEYFVFDEIHQYQGLRGAHASQIIRNIRQIRDDNAVYIGASATVDSPEEFGAKLFGFTKQARKDTEDFTAEPSDITAQRPFPEDIDDSNSDSLFYYFMLTDREAEPGIASQYLQHAMMVGRSLLQPQDIQPENSDKMSLYWGDSGGTPRRKLLTFIQSKSQIHRLEQQFTNADKDRRLWELHSGKEPGSWRDLAQRTSHEFLDSPELLDNPICVYSGEGNVDDIDDADIIHGTNFLEVGVDIDNLSFISLYRPPENITAFRQRSGRAAREQGSSGHVFVHLSDKQDSNFYYRADRFIDKNVTTPIRPQNEIISWIHDRFIEYYETLEKFQGDQYESYSGVWYDDENAPVLLSRYFKRHLGWDRFYDLLKNPQNELEEFDEMNINETDLLNEQFAINNLQRTIERRVDQINKQLDQIRKTIGSSTDEVLLASDSAQKLIRRVAKKGGGVLDSLEQHGDEHDGHRESIRQIQMMEDPTSNIDTVIDDLRNTAAYAVSQAVHSPEIIEFQESISTLQQLNDDDTLERFSTERSALYFLQRSLEYIDEYDSARFAHGQLRAIKHLFRAAYYYNRCLKEYRGTDVFQLNSAVAEAGGDIGQLDGVQPEYSKIWYVPPNYFDDAGKYFTLERPSDDSESDSESNDYSKPGTSEESIASLLSQYIPFKVEHQSSVSDCHVFQPPVVNRNGTRALDFSGLSIEEVRNGICHPNRIKLDEVQDLSGTKAQSVFEFDPQGARIVTTDESGSAASMPCKIFSTAQIKTELPAEEATSKGSEGHLQLVQGPARAWIDGITLDVTPQRTYEDDEGEEFYGEDKNTDIDPIELPSTEPKLGYELNSRAIVWDIEPFFAQFEDDGELDEEALTKAVRTLSADDIDSFNYKNFDEVSPRESACVTAAHLLELLIADVAGVDPNLLLYGYDSDDGRVYVFEQTEGGRGIVDLFFQLLQQRPTLVLNSLYRLLHNPQVLNERIWADESAVASILRDLGYDDDRDVSQEDIDIETAQETLRGELDIHYPDSIERIASDFTATLERIVEHTGRVSFERLVWLKHDIAVARVKGKCPRDDDDNVQIPDDIRTDYEDVFDELGAEAVRALFLSPDIDSCQANLQLDQTITSAPQEQALSYCILEQLERYIVETVPKEEGWEQTKERGQYWAWLDNDTEEVLFLKW